MLLPLKESGFNCIIGNMLTKRPAAIEDARPGKNMEGDAKMQYVDFGKTGIKVSRMGFGCMRLPEAKEGEGLYGYDEEESLRMLKRGYELGVNYFDTAPGYCKFASEIIVGKAVKSMPRDQVYISTKNPIENASGDDYEKRLEASLQRMDMDYIDFYHFWGINLESFEKNIDMKDGPMSRAIKLKEQGIIKHISFSFHGAPNDMIEIIKRGDGILSSVLCQYNLLDRANEDAIAFADEKGLGVVIMSPVGGGRLGAPSKAIMDMMPGKVESTAETALRFVLNNKHVDIALSGMSTMEQVEENCRVASNMEDLSKAESERVDKMLEENKRLAELYCTGCDYCMPCPQKINIPDVFKMMNTHRVYGLTSAARSQYAGIGKWNDNQNATACTECGECEAKCPQKIKIREQLKATHATLG